MISTAIYGTATYLALVAVFNFLPSYEEMPLPEGFLEAFQTMFSYMIAWNEILPIDTLVLCAGIVLAAQMTIFSWRGLIWFINIVRGTAQ